MPINCWAERDHQHLRCWHPVWVSYSRKPPPPHSPVTTRPLSNSHHGELWLYPSWSPGLRSPLPTLCQAARRAHFLELQQSSRHSLLTNPFCWDSCLRLWAYLLPSPCTLPVLRAVRAVHQTCLPTPKVLPLEFHSPRVFHIFYPGDHRSTHPAILWASTDLPESQTRCKAPRTGPTSVHSAGPCQHTAGAQ